MRILVLLLLMAACANQIKAPESPPVVEKEKVQEAPEAEKPPRKKPLPQKPTVIVVPTPPPIPTCPPPAKTEKQQILQDMNCLYLIEKDRLDKAKP